MNGKWSHLSLMRGEDDGERFRAEDAFKEAHPGAELGPVGWAYVGYVPYTVDGEERSITMRANDWRTVLRSLEEYFADDEPDTG